MPTILPPPHRKEKPRLSVFSVLFNTFLVASALALTFALLVREEQYALAQANSLPAIETNAALTADGGGAVQPR